MDKNGKIKEKTEVYDMEEYDLSLIFKKKFISKGLKSLLNQVLKDDLEIGISVMTGYHYDMTKDNLIHFYIENYEELLDFVLTSFHSDIHDLIQLMIENNGELEFTNMDPRFAILLKMYFIAFPVVKNGKNTLVMANEVYTFLKEYNDKKIENQIKLNDLVIDYTRGLISCYGSFEIDIIFDYIKEYENLDLKIEDYFLLLNNDSLLSGYDFKNEIIYSYQIEEINHFHETRRKYKQLHYYHLTKEQILNGYEYTEVEEDILDFFENELDMPTEMAQQGLYILLDAIQIELPFEEIKKMLKQFYINAYEHKKLEKIVEKLYYCTRLWSLKGHTKYEVEAPKMIKFPKMR